MGCVSVCLHVCACTYRGQSSISSVFLNHWLPHFLRQFSLNYTRWPATTQIFPVSVPSAGVTGSFGYAQLLFGYSLLDIKSLGLNSQDTTHGSTPSPLKQILYTLFSILTLSVNISY